VQVEGERHALVSVDPPWGAPPDEAARAAAASAALWAKGLTLTAQADGDALWVQLENSGAGHAVPTGATHLRDVWVDVEGVDGEGRPFVTPRVLELGAKLMRGGVEVVLVTDADTVASQGLSPGERRRVRVTLPAGARDVRAVLFARAVRASALDALGLGARAREVPALRIAAAP
jgi:hypothetical protein